MQKHQFCTFIPATSSRTLRTRSEKRVHQGRVRYNRLCGAHVRRVHREIGKKRLQKSRNHDYRWTCQHFYDSLYFSFNGYLCLYITKHLYWNIILILTKTLLVSRTSVVILFVNINEKYVIFPRDKVNRKGMLTEIYERVIVEYTKDFMWSVVHTSYTPTIDLFTSQNTHFQMFV